MARLKRFVGVILISGIVISVLLGIGMGLEELFAENGYRIFTSFITGLIPAIISLFFPTKEEKERTKRLIEENKRKAAEQKRRQEEEAQRKIEEGKAREAAKKAPGCYSMDNVDLLTFGCTNNVLTAGNCLISFKVRNRNPYDVMVGVRFKYSDGWESSVHTYEVGGNQIRNVETLGQAWHKATDITLDYVR